MTFNFMLSQVRTSGTEPPHDLTIKKVTDTSAELNWNPAVVFGNNRLLSYVVRWTRLDPNEKDQDQFMDHMNLHKREGTATINNLVPGMTHPDLLTVGLYFITIYSYIVTKQ